MSKPIFTANVPGSDRPTVATQQATDFRDRDSSERYRPVSHQAAPSANPTTALNSSTTMHYSLNTQQGRDAAALNELTTITVNKALDALKANRPDDAATALRSALGFADRLVAVNGRVVTANARQANEFHDYDVNTPMGDVKPDPVYGSYDMNNPQGD